ESFLRSRNGSCLKLLRPRLTLLIVTCRLLIALQPTIHTSLLRAHLPNAKDVRHAAASFVLTTPHKHPSRVGTPYQLLCHLHKQTSPKRYRNQLGFSPRSVHLPRLALHRSGLANAAPAAPP